MLLSVKEKLKTPQESLNNASPISANVFGDILYIV